MTRPKDWRDTFCGRESELAALVSHYEDVAAGKGPRLAVVLGDRGMGKTRLVQEFYRVLATRFDPQNYWPDAKLFTGNNLNVGPDLRDAEVRAHYASFNLIDRPMPFLWWGFRLSDDSGRNAKRADMAAHRASLEPHLLPVRIARGIAAAQSRLRSAGVDTLTELGKKSLQAAVELFFPQLDLAGKVLGVALDFGGKGLAAGQAKLDQRGVDSALGSADLLSTESQRLYDIHKRTLDDLGTVLATTGETSPLPVVVFCDDAQFARTGGDEGVSYLISELWERAHLAGWPLLLVLSHWAVEWHRTEQDDGSLASKLLRSAQSPQFGLVLDLPKESTLAQLVLAGLPGLPADDVALLLGKADGNPQALIELVDLIRGSPAWRKRGSGDLTAHARSEIERSPTKLSELVLRRLRSDATPEAVRQAVALSSVQGMEFLRHLTNAASLALGLGSTDDSLTAAERPHRLVVGMDAGIAGFVQRAYREAAGQLISGHVGDPQEVESTLLDAAIALVDNADRYAGLTASEQAATWGVLAGLAQSHADAAMRVYAGRGLLKLIKAALGGAQGTDFARAAELAIRFEQGVQNKWRIEDFAMSDMRNALDAISNWYGPARMTTLADELVQVHRLIAAEIGTPDSRLDLSMSLYYRGLAAEERDNSNEADLAFRECLDIRRELADKLDAPDSQRDVSIALVAVGNVAKARGNLAEADAHYRESEGIAREAASRLATPKALRDLAVILTKIGNLARDKGDYQEAEMALRESLSLSREVDKQLGSVESLRDVSAVLTHVSDLARVKGELQEAKSGYHESVSVCRDVSRKLGTPESQRDLSLSLDRLGATTLALGDLEEAEALCRESVVISREVSNRLGTSKSQRDLSIAIDGLGAAVAAKGSLVEAEAFYREGLGIRRQLWSRLGSAQSQQDVLSALGKLGDLAQAKGELAESVRLYRELLEASQSQAGWLDSIELGPYAVAALNKVAEIALTQGDLSETEMAYREIVAINRQIADRLNKPESKRDVLHALNRVREFAEAQGELAAVEPVYIEMLNISRELAGREGSTKSKQEKCVCGYLLAEFLRRQGRLPEALQHLVEVRPIFDQIAMKLGTQQASSEAQYVRNLIEQLNDQIAGGVSTFTPG